MKSGKLSILLVLVLVAGFLLAVLSPPEPASAAGTINQEVTDGLSNANNTQSWSSAVFQSKLYIGTVNVADGPEIHCYEGNFWEILVGASAPEPAGFGDPTAAAMACMAVYDNYLYVGTGTIMGSCEVWRWDGATWTAVVGGGSAVPAGFGGNNVDAMSMAVYGGELYLATRNDVAGVEIWRYDGADWTQSVGNLPEAFIAAGFGDTNNTTAFNLCTYRENLYAGTFNPVTGCEVWAFDGTDWTQSVGNQPPALIASGFGSTDNFSSPDMQEYEGKLYVGTQNDVNGCEVWSFDTVNWTRRWGPSPPPPWAPVSAMPPTPPPGVCTSTIPGSSLGRTTGPVARYGASTAWVEPGCGRGVAADYTGPGFGDAANQAAVSAATFGNRMYIGTSNPNGYQLYSYYSSTTWYLAEGSTAGGFETWVLVQNPNTDPVTVDLDLQDPARARCQGPRT